MFIPAAITFIIIFFVIIAKSGKRKAPYDAFPNENDDVDYWRNLNN